LSTASHVLAGLTPPPSSLYIATNRQNNRPRNRPRNRQQNRQLSNCLGVYIDVDIFRYSYRNKLISNHRLTLNVSVASPLTLFDTGSEQQQFSFLESELSFSRQGDRRSEGGLRIGLGGPRNVEEG
jgi:hypothetical protein